jgi:adenylosuccinate lyase
MAHHALNAISPIDGRYIRHTQALSNYFSESALMKYRVRVEVEYFIALCETGLSNLPKLSSDQTSGLRNLYLDFTSSHAEKIKEFERVTNHDVKAVEYFIKEHLQRLGLKEHEEFIHFGLTSQDINNTSVPLSIKEAVEEVYLPSLSKIVSAIARFADEWQTVPMLARTHGQPASPTTLGKELKVFQERLESQLTLLQQIPFTAKFGGATGNLNAHHVAYPTFDWVSFANKFVSEQLGLTRQQVTTQIEHYDNMSALFDAIKRINTILIDLDRDVWTYISMEYFKQKIVAGEVGSSAMPHKVNPIDFENSEGNLGMANAIFEYLSAKLPVSRLQRDLTDSTVLRNVGVPFGHTLIGLNSLNKGLGKLLLNKDKLERDLEDNWAVVAEAIQTILRRERFPKPYEALRDLTRTNVHITQKTMAEFIDQLKIDDRLKAELKAITPHNYTGISAF